MTIRQRDRETKQEMDRKMEEENASWLLC